ncbi:MAG: aspartate:alanine exchanger family transporter [Anaerolineae bacterium]
MIEILVNSPMLLLFVVVAIGYPLGQIRIGGSSLGVAAVLFVGLAFGALDPNMKLPEIVYLLGLVIFVYTVGLSSGPGFFASFRRKGLRDNVFVASVLLMAFALAIVAHRVLDLKPTLVAGMFSGSLTNTPALAGLLEHIKTYAPPELVDEMLNEPVVGYSIAYPMGVIGMIAAIAVLQRVWRIDYEREAAELRELGAGHRRLVNRTVRVTDPDAGLLPLKALAAQHGWDVLFGRMQRDGNLSLAKDDTRLQVGDLVSMIGAPEDLDRATAFLGEESRERLELDRSEYDFRRVFVSNPKVAGHRLRDLDLQQQYGAIVTRVRRGDVEFLAHDDTVLELGDRVRVVALRENMEAVSAFFGDSYRALSEIDVMTFGLGVAAGLIIGMIPVPLPGGVVFRLGFAGGPLLVALVLSAVGRTGPLVWQLPYSASLTLRQVGLILFLAGVGTRAGYAFFNTLGQSGGLSIFVAGAVITCVTAFLTLWIGHRLLKIPMGMLSGMLAGLQTQPAVLGSALEQARNDLPNIGYATVYPVATIMKILLAQLLLSMLR